MSRCAACLTPFAANERKIVADTEVFHDRCVALIPQSVTHRLKRKAIELDRIVKQTRIDVAENARLRTSVDAANADARRLQADNDRLARELSDTRAERDAYARARDHYIELAERLRFQENEHRKRIEALEREVALHQTIQGNPRSAVVSASAAPDPPPDTRDDAEIMFSLIEIDPPK